MSRDEQTTPPKDRPILIWVEGYRADYQHDCTGWYRAEWQESDAMEGMWMVGIPDIDGCTYLPSFYVKDWIELPPPPQEVCK